MKINTPPSMEAAGDRFRKCQRQWKDSDQPSPGAGGTAMQLESVLETATAQRAGDTAAAERHTKRMKRLSATATEELAKRMAAEASCSPLAVRSQGDVIGSIGLERVIGRRDLVDIAFLELGIAMGRGVGKIKLGNGAGTGFLVGPGLLMTNHHVITRVMDARIAMLQMDYQENSRGELLPVQTFELDPDKFFVTSEELDYTIVGVSDKSTQGKALSSYPWIHLIPDLGKIEVHDPVNIIQHPRGELKQIAFRSNEVMDIPGMFPHFLYYTTDTEPGSSGSPCFNDQWEMVALHHSGVPRMDDQKRTLKKDGNVWVRGQDAPELIDWIGNEGIRVSALVKGLKEANLTSEWSDLRARMLEMSAPNPIELARSEGETSPTPARIFAINEQKPTSNSQTWTIPLEVTVNFGPPQLAGQAPTAATIAAAPVAAVVAAKPMGGEEVVKIDPDFKARLGYDPDFLGVRIPLPKLSAALEQDTVEVPAEFRKANQQFLLHYHHYSVAMNKRRRMCWYSACNIDGDNRPKITRSGDKWFLDPRIDRKFQCGEEVYADARIDRGHVTRREDTAWGANLDAATRANNDTFHFTNACPQLSAFNQGKDRWQGLENFLLGKAKKELRRLVVITGPVFARTDPQYRNDKMDFSVRVPLQFWKVCVLVREDGSLAATGFVLGQEDVTELDGFDEKFEAGQHQIEITELERRTGLDFGELRDHDHFAQGGDPGTLEVDRGDSGKLRIKPIRTFEDIVL